jgi:hypothetical protein
MATVGEAADLGERCLSERATSLSLDFTNAINDNDSSLFRSHETRESIAYREAVKRGHIRCGDFRESQFGAQAVQFYLFGESYDRCHARS